MQRGTIRRADDAPEAPLIQTEMSAQEWAALVARRNAELKAKQRDDGLTEAEGEVMDALVDAVEAYNELEVQHPNERSEFIAAIHRAQDLLAVRIARRHYPEAWINHGESS